ncbi:hypothetical protein B0H16DRAFT_1633682 [Mycena metata]|uniref:Uncharacterized protein n=1 Tax=Mycena metata TaxID=1033252 RepID=A0AAD7GXF6_9AGAR|nr:hypothetical protein B0H16DRAFT_1633682 [Mycena metata]
MLTSSPVPLGTSSAFSAGHVWRGVALSCLACLVLEKTGLRMKKLRLEEKRSTRCSRGCFAGRSSLFALLPAVLLCPVPHPPPGYNHFGKLGRINFLNSVMGCCGEFTDTYMGSCFCVLVRRLAHTVVYIPSSASTRVIPSVYISPCDYFLL